LLIRRASSNGENRWRNVIDKEVKSSKVAFDILPEGSKSKPHPGYTLSSGHLVFDVRITLERKARCVKAGLKTPEPELSAYVGVVSRESVHIALTYAAPYLLNLKLPGPSFRSVLDPIPVQASPCFPEKNPNPGSIPIRTIQNYNVPQSNLICYKK